MAIKIVASKTQKSSQKIKIQKSPDLMPVVFHNVSTGRKALIRLTPSLLLGDAYWLLLKLNFIINPPVFFKWNLYLNGEKLDDSKTLEENGISNNSEVELRCQEIKAVEEIQTVNQEIIKLDTYRYFEGIIDKLTKNNEDLNSFYYLHDTKKNKMYFCGKAWNTDYGLEFFERGTESFEDSGIEIFQSKYSLILKRQLIEEL